MADNIQLNAATGTTGAVLASDEITSGTTTSHYQYVKVAYGSNGAASIVTGTNGLPVNLLDTSVAVTNATATNMNVTIGNSSLAVTQATATNMNVTVGNSSIAVTSATATNFNADVTINGNATVVQSTASNLNARVKLNGGDAIATPGSAAVAKCVQLAGSDGTNAQTVSVTTAGSVKVSDGGGTLSVDDGAGSLTVDGTVTANLGATDNAVLDSIDTNTTGLNGCVSGSELQVDIVAALPAGTNAIGKLAANSGVDIGDVDVLSQPALDRTTDNVGVALQTDAIMSDTTALTPKFAVIDDATSGDNTLVAAVAGKKIRVLSLFMVSAGTVNARFESGAAGTALTGQMNLVANSGFTLPFNPVGWFETASNTLLNLELSAAVSVDGCLVYVEV